MDAAGNVLATPPDRSVAAFEACLAALQKYEAVAERAKAGDGAMTAELLLLDHALGRLTNKQYAARRDGALAGATDEQKARIEQVGVDFRVWVLVGVSMEPNDGLERAAQGMLEILAAGQRPSGSPKYAWNFWSILGRWAQRAGNAALCRRAAKGIRADFAGDTRRTNFATALDHSAKGLDARDALVARQQGGEKGLEATILLAEYKLKAVTAQQFHARCEAALAVATDAQREAIEQAKVDSVVEEAWRGSMTAAGLKDAGPKLFAALTKGGREPSGYLKRAGWSTLMRWAHQNKELDADALERIVAGIRKQFAGMAPYLKRADALEARAKAARK